MSGECVGDPTPVAVPTQLAKFIPFCVDVCVCVAVLRQLNLSQFKQFTRVFRELTARVEESRVKELERLVYLQKKVRACVHV
jgi:hypothetical protein